MTTSRQGLTSAAARTLIATLVMGTAVQVTGVTSSSAAVSGSGADNARIVGELTIAGVTTTAIKIYAYDWNIAVPVDPISGGASGRPAVGDFLVTRKVDGLSPKLMIDSALGRNHADAVISIYQPGTTTVQVKYRLTNVAFSLHSAGDKGRTNGFPIEDLKMSFQTITVTVGSNVQCYNRSTASNC
jgi:type VI protein secretion system component Hcp